MTLSSVQSPRTGAYWGQLAEMDHAVQVYRADEILLDSLESFVASGLRSGESVVVIATAAHLHELEKRLRGGWVQIDRCRWEDRYIAVLAHELLAMLLVNGVPDEGRFEKCMGEIIARARGEGRRLRAFGEMVGILWTEGNKDGAIRLEHLWTRLQRREKFPLFCAYPRAHIVPAHLESDIQMICAAHSRVVPGYV